MLIADPETTKKRIEKARRGREVTHLPLKDEPGQIKAVLPADGAVTVFTLIDLMAGATKTADDDRSVAERRADALTDLATELLTHGQLDLRGLLEPCAPSTDDDVIDDADADSPDRNSWYDEEGLPVDEAGSLANEARCLVNMDGSIPDRESRCPESTENVTTPSVDSSYTAGPTCPGSPESVAEQSLSNGSRPIALSGRGLSDTGKKADPWNSLTRQGRRPHLTVTMSLSTLMALDELPAHLEGYGAITAQLATAIAGAAASVSFAVVDPHTGAAQHASARIGYRPSQKQRAVVTTLAATCRFPSCRQPAWRCDLDHRTAYDHEAPDSGGPTCPCNLDPHCRRHHLLEHHSDWTARRQPDGAMAWRSPTGHRYIDAPTELTLPGELLTRVDGDRTTTGAADVEHRAQCAEPLSREEPIPVAMKVHLAERRALHAHVLQRIRSAPRATGSAGDSGAAAAGPSTPAGPPDPAFIRTVIGNALRPPVVETSVLDAIRQRARATFAAESATDDGRPPF